MVYNVSRADAGIYDCVAENERERRTASAQFRIRGEAGMLGTPSMVISDRLGLKVETLYAYDYIYKVRLCQNIS